MVVLSTTTAVTPPRLSTTECPAGTVYFTDLLVRLVTRGAASGCGFSPAGSGAPAPGRGTAREGRPRVTWLVTCPPPVTSRPSPRTLPAPPPSRGPTCRRAAGCGGCPPAAAAATACARP